MKTPIRPLLIAASIAVAFSAPSHAENIKVAFIDTMSGAFAPLGQNQFNSFQITAEIANKQKWAADNTLEFVAFDSKGSPQEALRQLKVVTDQGFRYITHGNGSGVALALVDAIEKHNERSPGKEIVYLNFSAIDPDLTNRKCSFWHFRFDANGDMKMEALTAFMANDPSIKKVYLIGQNYAHGHQVRRAAREYLALKRPDIEIVGDDLHPIAQVKDFSPYVAKIRASGADTVITGNWGADLALLIKASKDANLNVNFLTYYAATTGVPTAMGAAGAGHVKQVSTWLANSRNTASSNEMIEAFKKRYKDDYYMVSTYSAVALLAKAIKESKSSDPIKVALAMEGMKVQSLNGEVQMRKTDHQLQQPLYVSTWEKANGKDIKFDQENTGYGWRQDQRFDSFVATQPTSCEMKRPGKS